MLLYLQASETIALMGIPLLWMAAKTVASERSNLSAMARTTAVISQ
jgi:hypothetical protein